MIEQVVINSIVAGSVYTLIAIGFSIIYSTTRFFHFAHGAVVTCGPYLVYLFTSVLGLPIALSIIVSIFLSAIIGMLIEMLVYRPLRTKGSSSLILLLSSFGVYIVLQNLISMIFGDDTKSLRSGIVHEGIEFLGAQITAIQIMIVIVSMVLLTVCWALIKYSRIGTAMRAIASDSELALVSGIEINRVILFAFLLGSALAAISGILISFDIDMTPTMGLNPLMMGVVAVIVGGVGSIPGAALGSFLLAFAQNFGVWKISSQWQDAIAFCILLLFLLFRPYGFLGKKIRKVEV